MTGLALVGCTESDLDKSVKSESVITFATPILSNQTKAPVAGEQVTKYDTDENFSVYAVYHEGAYVNSTSGNANVYFSNVDAGYNSTAKCWDTQSGNGGKDYYWPKKDGAKLTFQAYSPTETTGTIGWTAANGFTLTDFTVQALTANQYDLMFSKRTYDKTSNTGGTYYVDPTDAVDINFQHALSSIVFKAAKDAAYDGTTIKLKQITLLNVFPALHFIIKAHGPKQFSVVCKMSGGISSILFAFALLNSKTHNIINIMLTTHCENSHTILVSYSSTFPLVTTAIINIFIIADTPITISATFLYFSVIVSHTLSPKK